MRKFPNIDPTSQATPDDLIDACEAVRYLVSSGERLTKSQMPDLLALLETVEVFISNDLPRIVKQLGL